MCVQNPFCPPHPLSTFYIYQATSNVTPDVHPKVTSDDTCNTVPN